MAKDKHTYFILVHPKRGIWVGGKTIEEAKARLAAKVVTRRSATAECYLTIFLSDTPFTKSFPALSADGMNWIQSRNWQRISLGVARYKLLGNPS